MTCRGFPHQALRDGECAGYGGTHQRASAVQWLLGRSRRNRHMLLSASIIEINVERSGGKDHEALNSQRVQLDARGQGRNQGLLQGAAVLR